MEWHPIKTAPRDRYILLYCPDRPRWDGNMEVGRWFGEEKPGPLGTIQGCFWSPGGPNGGLELNVMGGLEPFTLWAELPPDPPPAR